MQNLLKKIGSLLTLSYLAPIAFSGFLFLNPVAVQAQEIHLQLKIERYTSMNSQVNVRTYLENLPQLEGFRLAAIEVEAAALNEVASTTVFVNEIQQGETLRLGPVPMKFLVFMNSDFFIGKGAEEIRLLTPTPTYIKTVNLTLMR